MVSRDVLNYTLICVPCAQVGEQGGSPSRAMAVDQNTEPLARGVSQACPQPCARAPRYIWRRRQQTGGSRQQEAEGRAGRMRW